MSLKGGHLLALLIARSYLELRGTGSCFIQVGSDMLDDGFP